MDIQKANFIKFNEYVDVDTQKSNLSLLDDVETKLTIKLGETMLPISEIKKFRPGYLININKDPSDLNLDIFIGDRKIATGEVVVSKDETFIRIKDL